MININNYVSEDTVLILIGNKSDLYMERKVTKEDGNNFVMEYNFDNFFEVSASKNSNINELLRYTIFTLVDMYTDSKKLMNNKEDNDRKTIVSIKIRPSVTSVKGDDSIMIANKDKGCCNC